MFKARTERVTRFGIRKFHVGVASVAVATGLLFLGPGSALADEVTPSSEVVAGAVSNNAEDIRSYAVSENWELVNRYPASNSYINVNSVGIAYSQAQTKVVRDDNSEVGVTVTIKPVDGNPEGTGYLAEGGDQSKYGATSEMLAGNPEPATVPALGVYTQPSPTEGGGDLRDKVNFNGKAESTILTFNFDKEVTDPILDFSGIGGNSRVQFGTGYSRGSFNATVFELLSDGVSLEKASEGVNLTVTDKMIEVTNKNAFHRSVVNPDYAGFYNDRNRMPNVFPAGTGSVRLKGTFKEVSFKLYHESTPFTAFSMEEFGTGAAYFTNTPRSADQNYGLGSDNINGNNKHYTDVIDYVAPNNNNIMNDDLLRMSIRLENPRGSVKVQYIDTEGNIIGTEYQDTTNQVPGTAYNTMESSNDTDSSSTKERPATITKDGKTYRLVKEAKDTTVGKVGEDGALISNNGSFTFGTDAATGQVAEGTKSVTFVYELVKPKGNVIVEYYDTEGNNIKETVEDTPETDAGATYDTKDHRPEKIEKGGNTYYYKEVKNTSKPEEGEVTEGTTTVQYVYEKSGNVNINYISTDGIVIKEKISDIENGKAGQAYQTAEEGEKPATIEFNGKTYKLVTAPGVTTTGKTYDAEGVANGTGDAPASGKVEAGKTLEVTYVYEEVKPTDKAVIIYRHVDSTGKVVKELERTQEFEGQEGQDIQYNPNKNEEVIDGYLAKGYRLVADGYGTGKQYDGREGVDTYYIDLTPYVVPVTPENPLKPGEDVPTDPTSPRTPDPADPKFPNPTEPTHPQDPKYPNPQDPAGGKAEDLTKLTEEVNRTITYYAMINGVKTPIANVIPTQTDKVDFERKGTINLVTGETTLENWNPQTGEFKTVTPKTEIEINGVKYTTTTVVNGETVNPTDEDKFYEVVYTPVETPKGDVIVEYKDEDGNVLKDPRTDTPTSPVGTDYNTDEPGENPSRIEKDGVTYERVRVEGTEQGKVVEGTTKVVYIYRKVVEPKGDVIVEYKDEDGNVLKDPRTDTPTSPVGTDYNTDEPGENPSRIEKDGVTYERVRVEGTEQGKVVEGTTKVVYIYRKVVEPKGDVIVEYKDEDGNVLKDPRTDTPTSPVGTDYNTDEPGENPSRIDKDGVTYERVRVEGTEQGKVVEGTTKVVYIYRKVVEPTPQIPERPTTPEKPTIPENPVTPPVTPEKPITPEQPTTPPTTPEKPEVPNKPVTPVSPEKPEVPVVETASKSVQPAGQKQLPETGDEANAGLAAGAGLLVTILAGFGLSRKKED